MSDARTHLQPVGIEVVALVYVMQRIACLYTILALGHLRRRRDGRGGRVWVRARKSGERGYGGLRLLYRYRWELGVG